ncbi:aminoacyl-histidine dipeptidase [Clostridium polynesiense]|uniref:aminoacyl-histidine dipeptidase n=1 Tax=Clostridium polynesiense TaxID=1325933 RepID=UPI00058F6D48|nr:aminoacyl-histidine dipeptidase [Clostridium polynesiense]
MTVLNNLEPKKVFHFFEEISNIPRGSGNEKEISDYLVKFAKERSLEVIQDEALNVIIKKPASKGYENAPVVVIQGHMDMVCEKNRDTVHDFEKDPIKLKVEGDYVFAQGTTLGADNGIAVAYALAVLDSPEMLHPALEVLITTEEETGMSGALAVQPENIKGRILLNIDSEEEGKLLVSCAGGIRNKVVLPIEWDNADEKYQDFEIKVRGLKGGHSGMDAIKQRANSNKIMGRILADINSELDIRLAAINGGSKTNAIPREMDAALSVKEEDVSKLQEKIEKWNKTLSNEYKTADPGLKITLENAEAPLEKVFSKDTTEKAVKLLYLIPNGIMSMSMEIEGLVQSSTNLGVVITNENEIEYHSAIRSSVGSLKEDITLQTAFIAEAFGAEIISQAGYPEWQYNAESKIRKISERVYKNLTGSDAEIVAIHAGLECGLFKEKFSDMDMISFGPNLYDVHTPNEHMSISSVKNLWEFLVELLKEIK